MKQFGIALIDKYERYQVCQINNQIQIYSLLY